MLKFLLPVVAFVPFSVFPLAECQASVYTLDLLYPSGGGTAGAAFEDSGSFVVSGVTFTVYTASSFPGATGSKFNATASVAGVDSDGVTSSDGEDSSRLDVGETLTFTLTFNESLWQVSLVNLDFPNSFGSGTGASVTTPAGTATVDSDSTNYSTTTGIWTPSSPVSFSSGNSVSISASSTDIYMQGMTFDIVSIAPIPEPTHAGVLLLFLTGAVGLRRQRSPRHPVAGCRILTTDGQRWTGGLRFRR